jgi:hypothetical protein
VRVGNEISQRTAELKQGYKDDRPDTPATPLTEVAVAPVVMTPPPTRSAASAKKLYWQERAFHHGADADASSEDMACGHVKRWLPTAFTPTGGGNMLEVLDEEEEEQGTTTTENSTKESTNKHQLALLQRLLKEQNNVLTMDCQEDPHYAAYETWYQKGLLTWRPLRPPLLPEQHSRCDSIVMVPATVRASSQDSMIETTTRTSISSAPTTTTSSDRNTTTIASTGGTAASTVSSTPTVETSRTRRFL